MAPERGAVLADPLESGLDRARDVDPSPLGIRCGLPIAAPKAHRASELACQRRTLFSRARQPFAVVEALGLLQLIRKLLEPLAILGLRLSVEDRPRVATRRPRGLILSRLDGDQIESVELAAGLAQQRGDLVQALRVPQPERRTLERDRPELALLPEERGSAETS